MLASCVGKVRAPIGMLVAAASCRGAFGDQSLVAPLFCRLSPSRPSLRAAQSWGNALWPRVEAEEGLQAWLPAS